MMATERPACRAAIVQALRFEFQKSPKQIADLMGLASQTVSHWTGGNTTVLPWDRRRFQQEAIEAADKVLKAGMN